MWQILSGDCLKKENGLWFSHAAAARPLWVDRLPLSEDPGGQHGSTQALTFSPQLTSGTQTQLVVHTQIVLPDYETEKNIKTTEPHGVTSIHAHVVFL